MWNTNITYPQSKMNNYSNESDDPKPSAQPSTLKRSAGIQANKSSSIESPVRPGKDVIVYNIEKIRQRQVILHR